MDRYFDLALAGWVLCISVMVIVRRQPNSRPAILTGLAVTAAAFALVLAAIATGKLVPLLASFAPTALGISKD